MFEFFGPDPEARLHRGNSLLSCNANHFRLYIGHLLLHFSSFILVPEAVRTGGKKAALFVFIKLELSIVLRHSSSIAMEA